MRRRLSLLLIPLALAMLWFARRAPVERTLAMRLGADAAEVREVGLHFARAADDRMARDLTLSFPAGARETEQRPIELAPGDYRVGVRVRYVAGPEAGFSREVRVEGDEPIGLDLRRAP